MVDTQEVYCKQNLKNSWNSQNLSGKEVSPHLCHTHPILRRDSLLNIFIWNYLCMKGIISGGKMKPLNWTTLWVERKVSWGNKLSVCLQDQKTATWWETQQVFYDRLWGAFELIQAVWTVWNWMLLPEVIDQSGADKGRWCLQKPASQDP